MKKPIIAITGGDPYFLVEIAGDPVPKGPFVAYPKVTTEPSTGRSFTVQIEATGLNAVQVNITETHFLPVVSKPRPAKSARRATPPDQPASDSSPAPTSSPAESSAT